jgi:hypothetical protein
VGIKPKNMIWSVAKWKNNDLKISEQKKKKEDEISEIKVPMF